MLQPASATRPRIEFAQSSDPGRDPNKQVNEDSCGYAQTPLGHLLVICDGMGGHLGGREASHLAIATIFRYFERIPPGSPTGPALHAAIGDAARVVYQLGGSPENRVRPGTTCVAVLIHERGVDIAHVGDSRAYMIRSGQIYPLTRDHSIVQGMIDAGSLTEEQAIGHPEANKITRALGMRPEVEVDVRPEPIPVYPGDVILLASDGLTDLALSHEILAATMHALQGGGVSGACETLVSFANHRGGHDNITVQIARVLDVSAGPSFVEERPAAPAAHAVAPGPPAGGMRLPPTMDQLPAEGAGGGVTPQLFGAHTMFVSPDLSAMQAAAHAQGHAAAPAHGGGYAPAPPPTAPMPTMNDPGRGASPYSPAPHGGGAPPGYGYGAYAPAPGHAATPGAPPYGTPPHDAASGYAPPGAHPITHPPDTPGYGDPSIPPSVSDPGARPSSRGVAILVIGLGVVVVVLGALLVWALALR